MMENTLKYSIRNHILKNFLKEKLYIYWIEFIILMIMKILKVICQMSKKKSMSDLYDKGEYHL